MTSPQPGTRKKTIEVSVSEPITLGSLRWLVEECRGLSDSSPVTVKENKNHMYADSDEEKITVRGEARTIQEEAAAARAAYER